MGVFWPVAVYQNKELFGTKLPRRKIVKHARTGERGAMLPSSAWPFVPDGCEQIFKSHRTQLVDKVNLFDPSKQVRSGQADDVVKAGKAELNLTRKGKGFTQTKSGDGDAPVMFSLGVADAQPSNIFSGIWGSGESMTFAGDDSDCDNEPVQRKLKRGSPKSKHQSAPDSSSSAQVAPQHMRGWEKGARRLIFDVDEYLTEFARFELASVVSHE